MQNIVNDSLADDDAQNGPGRAYRHYLISCNVKIACVIYSIDGTLQRHYAELLEGIKHV